jgi:UDP-glucose:glycoprotein glucosyltransferase
MFFSKVETFAPLNRASMAATLADHLSYLTRSDDLSKLYSMSAWIVADLETSQGRELVRGALAHIKSSSQMRIAVIHNSKAPGKKIRQTIHSFTVNIRKPDKSGL